MIYNPKASPLETQYRIVNKKIEEPLIVFTFDDAYSTDYTKGYPYMKAKGIKGTSYVVSSWINKPNFCTWQQLKEMREGGFWDIQCQTNTHPHLTQLTDEEIRTEMESVNNFFAINGIPLPKHMCYPYGETEERVSKIISEYRLSQRLTGSIKKTNISNKEQIKDSTYTVIRGMSLDNTNDAKLKEIKQLIDWTYQTNGIAIFYCHEIMSEPNDYDYNIVESYFNQIIDYISNTGIKTVTVSELYDIIFSK